ncbi:MAG: hypothetical protein M3280_00560 [Actinomycetota bacterium]|nr:hypothetical protein [Actinomycetota bacterium]
MSPAHASLAAGARAAGCVFALGYLLGLVPGSLFAPIGALVLITIGRTLLLAKPEVVRAALALGVIALAITVGGLRWGSGSLDAIRGAQGVLGPTLAVAPQEAAVGAALAVGGAALALGLWLEVARPTGVWGWGATVAEGATAALALTTVFWGPAVTSPDISFGDFAAGAGEWAAAVAALLVVGCGLAFFLPRLRRAWSWVVLAVGAAATLAGAIIVPSLVIQ